jgi:hypothetical protein
MKIEGRDQVEEEAMEWLKLGDEELANSLSGTGAVDSGVAHAT